MCSVSPSYSMGSGLPVTDLQKKKEKCVLVAYSLKPASSYFLGLKQIKNGSVV